MTPHKHHDLIVAWAKGAQIQAKSPSGNWFDVTSPETFRCPIWEPQTEYRIKPEPAPDVILYAIIEGEPEFGYAKVQTFHADICKLKGDTCMFVFDGETGKLKKAEVINEE